MSKTKDEKRLKKVKKLIAELDRESAAYKEGRSGVAYWDPQEEGDQIVGALEKITEGHGEYGDRPILNVRALSGELVAVWVFHAVLESEVQEKRPKIGAEIAIRFLGRGENSSGQEYKIFRLVAGERIDGIGDYWTAAKEMQSREPDPDEQRF